uniref:Uncharacterized protein n=1 Tax=Timema monikensis TaxID=170555 RepID=A0A7R9HHV9_9NEOP|nr:unnamed protein product [Timema monikensis]
MPETVFLKPVRAITPKLANALVVFSSTAEDGAIEFRILVGELGEHIKSVTDNEVCSLLNLGTFGLHDVHGSLRTGVESVDWDINSLMKG